MPVPCISESPKAMFYHIVSEWKHIKSAVFWAVKIYLPENENGNILL